MSGPGPDRAARRDGHLPAWLVERLAFEPEAAPAGDGHHQHHQTCERCRAAVEELRREREAFLAARPARPFLAAVKDRAASPAPGTPPRWWTPRRWLLAGGLAAATAAVLVGLWPAGDGGIRFKGQPVAFTVFASRGGEPARPLEPGDALRPGDVLRFGVTSPGPGHVVVASVDEAGRVSRYYPMAGNGSAAIEGREYLQLLPGSVVLDETVGREWIALVVSAAPLEQRRVEEALRKAWRERAGDRLGPVALEAQVRVVAVAKVRP